MGTPLHADGRTAACSTREAHSVNVRSMADTKVAYHHDALAGAAVVVIAAGVAHRSAGPPRQYPMFASACGPSRSQSCAR